MTHQALPLHEAVSLIERRYLSLLGLDIQLPTWQATTLSALRLADAVSDDPGTEEPSHALVIAGREAELLEADEIKNEPSDARWTLVSYLETDVVPLAAAWGAFAAVGAYQRKLARSRDAGLRLPARKIRTAIESLHAEENEFLRIQAGAAPLIQDIERGARSLPNEIARYRATDYLRVDQLPGEEESFLREFADWLSKQSRALAERMSLATVLYPALSNTLAARANLRLQRTIKWLTWVLLALGV